MAYAVDNLCVVCPAFLEVYSPSKTDTEENAPEGESEKGDEKNEDLTPKQTFDITKVQFVSPPGLKVAAPACYIESTEWCKKQMPFSDFIVTRTGAMNGFAILNRGLAVINEFLIR